MPRARRTNGAVVALLAVILGTLMLAAVGVGVGVWLIGREAEFRRDRDRVEQIDDAIRFEAAAGGERAERVGRQNRLIDEQNALVRKWPGRMPGRVEQQRVPAEW